MSGISDVRLTLYAQELVEQQEAKIRSSAPAGLSTWALFRHRRLSRQALLRLTDDQLKDIGLTREQAKKEGLKPFWKD